MSPVRIDTAHWPIVLHISEGAPTDAEFDAYVAEATAILSRAEPHVVIMDTTGLTHVSAYGRATKKEWLARHGELLRRHCLGTAMILSSPVLRFISSTIMLIRPFPTPYYVCETLDEAMEWARGRLSRFEAAIPPPPPET